MSISWKQWPSPSRSFAIEIRRHRRLWFWTNCCDSSIHLLTRAGVPNVSSSHRTHSTLTLARLLAPGGPSLIVASLVFKDDVPVPR
ncbi:unnamed protein product [Fusarium venenatum]|uniref:Uncharacterized protein n=1 Tax=Fusarium venenatum TaxID=56646 RepID=A0A2L2TGF7_9HYPO|nr:uncharacterized protein FVRRES_10129 [Fusarium venenatum]CEI70052.1 unnamed protein product [Fusarium venenatum]